MRRVISVFLPQWAMDLRKRRLRQANAWQPDKPFVIAEQTGQQHNVVAVNAAAKACGIVPGIAVSRARVIYPDVKVEPARPQDDARALSRLAVRALRYSPLVAPCPPDGLWIDATGVAHLFGGEAPMVGSIARRLRSVGLSARVAIAGNPAAAWAWARYGQDDPVLALGTEKKALEMLSLRALRLPQTTVQALRHVGLKTIGDLCRIPRATIPTRFGTDVLLRLDQALGLAPETITPILPPQAKRRHLNFIEPIATPDDLQRVIVHLTDELCVDLEESQEGALKLDLVFGRVDDEMQVIRTAMARPSRDARHIAKLLTEKLPTIDPGFGIETATLTAWRVGALQPVQLATDGRAAAERDWGALVDRLVNRLGSRNVFKIKAVASDIPERAAVPTNPMSSQNLRAHSWPQNWPRPMRLLSPPEPVTVIALLPDYPPAKFRWRDETHSVRIADGPERIFGEWWQASREFGEMRDYFRVENDRGERYWLFRSTGAQEDRWYMHGVFA
jgi:protein ImuB